MYSLPESPRTICTCGDEVAIGRVVPAQVEYRIIMSSLEFSFFLLCHLGPWARAPAEGWARVGAPHDDRSSLPS